MEVPHHRRYLPDVIAGRHCRCPYQQGLPINEYVTLTVTGDGVAGLMVVLAIRRLSPRSAVDILSDDVGVLPGRLVPNDAPDPGCRHPPGAHPEVLVLPFQVYVLPDTAPG
jgi:hypothetical protein